MVVANKPPSIATQADDTGDLDFLQKISDNVGQSLHLVHRLDRPASGVLVFGRDKSMLAHLNRQFSERQVQKTYWAVVGQAPEPAEGHLTHFLRKEHRKKRSFAFNKPLHHTKKAELSYKILAQIERYHLLEVQLHTGRYHQIRAQLSAIGSPIKGDVKYGFRRGNPDRSIHLHAKMLSFTHPYTQERVSYEAEPPKDVIWELLMENMG